MITLIQQAEVYTPKHLGKKDILIADRRIAGLEDHLEISGVNHDIHRIDGAGLIAVPGFIDNHVHICGGGGEGGFATRTAEIRPEDILGAGVTTVIGVRGTDGFTRSMENLIAKAKGLKEHGISCWVLTGSYQVPLRTLTDSIESDIILVEEIIGAGEIALADHRSSHAAFHEIARLASSARIGGLLSGKSGITNIHLGSGAGGFTFIDRLLAESDIPIKQLIPTHVNRTYELLCQGFEYAKNGGFIDLTASGYIEGYDDVRTKCSKAVGLALDSGVPIEHISFSSDGQGSLPIFDSSGEQQGYDVGSCSALLAELKDAVFEEKIPLEKALSVITVNPATMYGLSGKGVLAPGYDADIVLLNTDFSINSIISGGRLREDFS